MFKQLIKKLRPKAVLVKYPEPMTAKDIENTFADQGQDSKIWQALDTIMDNALLDAVNDVADPSHTVEKMSHAAGRVDALAMLKSQIEEFKKMEEWEDILHSELGEKCTEYLEKGLTLRQVIGVLETIKAELLPNIIVVEE